MREIHTLLCCITLSSLREKSDASSRGSKKDFWRRCRGGLHQVKSRFVLPLTCDFWRRCRGYLHQVKTYQVPIINSYPLHYIICHFPLVFLSPTSPLPFYSPSFSVPLLFSSLPLFARSLFACVPRWPYQKVLILTLEGWNKLKTTLEVLCPCSLSIIISSERSLKNKTVLWST